MANVIFFKAASSLSRSVFPIHLAHRVSPIQKTDPVDVCVLRESTLLDCKKNRIHSQGDESVNLYITQRICLGHSEGKAFECAKFHSLQQGYIAGLGRDVGNALVKDIPREQLPQANTI